MKHWTLVLFAVLSISWGSATAQTTGDCGKGLSWTFSSNDGKLYITGKGTMYDYVTSWNGIRSSVTSIVMSSGVQNIGDVAFKDFVNLRSITLSAAVKTIGFSAFYNCSKLTFITIPANVETIQNDAFMGCTQLSSIVFSGNKIAYVGGGAFSFTPWSASLPDGIVYISNVLYKYKGVAPANTSVVIPEGIVAIADSAFSGCSNITTISIPGTVTRVGNYAFAGCDSLRSIQLPANLKFLGTGCFYSCKGLSSVNIPTSINEIPGNAFFNCRSLIDITLPKSLKWIGSDAFCSCPGLTTVVIPDSVTSIGSGAFSFCSKLENIQIPASIQAIQSDAFLGTGWYNNQPDGIICLGTWLLGYKGYISGNDSLVVPEGVETIAENALSSHYQFTSIQLPLSLKIIGSGAFSNCTNLKSINIPKNVKTIGQYAFSDCDSLTSITLPYGITAIGYRAFSNTCLTSLVIPDGVMGFNDCVEDCKCLTSLTLPKTVSWLSPAAFYNCTGLTELKCANPTPPQLGSVYSVYTAFINFDPSKCTLKVPVGSKSAYESSAVWSQFGSIVEEVFTATPSVSNEKVEIRLTASGMRISGCKPNDEIRVYSLSGACVYRSKVGTGVLHPNLKAGNIYLIHTPLKTIKLRCSE